MKRLICTFFAILLFSGCFAQQYDVWVKTVDNQKTIKGKYGFSNDSLLMTFYKGSLLFPSKDTYFTWDDVKDLKIRNKSRNQMGQIIGACAGGLALYIIDNSMKKSSNSNDPGLGGIYLMITLPVFVGAGTLIGHLATNKKTVIPLQGKNPSEKNRILKSKINRKN